MITAIADGTGSSADDPRAVPWWSYTKTVLASAALVLVGQDRLQLDTALPGYAFTLRQVLQHRAGLRDYGSLDSYHAAVAAGDPPWSAEEMTDRAEAGRLVFPPGQGWAYSNIGYFIIRRLVEQGADAPLDAALQRLVLGPLGIAGVRLAETATQLDDTAWGNPGGYQPGWVYHGLLVGPAESAVLLLHRLLAGALLPPALLRTTRAADPVIGAMPGRPWTSGACGLGLMVGEAQARRYIGHTGAGPGSVAAVYQQDTPYGARTAAAFAPADDPGLVERRVLSLLDLNNAVTPKT